MSDTSWREEVGRHVLTLQIVVASLLGGSVAFLAVAAVLVHLDVVQANREAASIMNLVLIVFLVADMMARVIVPRILVGQGRRRIAAGQWSLPQAAAGQAKIVSFLERAGDAGQLLFVYQAKTIVAAALLEGLAFFGIIVYLITRSPLGIVVAIAMILGLALHVPTRSGVVHWIEDQLELIDQDRQSRAS